MMTLRISPEPEQIEFSIKTRSLITDWLSAQRKFTAGMARRFAELSPVQPHDLDLNHANSLGDVSCSCRLFRGAASIVLKADTLRLNFENVPSTAYGVVFKTIREGWEWLMSEFPDTGVAWSSLQSNQNVIAPDNAVVDRYLDQFSCDSAMAIAEKEPGIRYRPSIRVTLKDQDGHWELHRSVEELRTVPNGLFITTSLYLPETDFQSLTGWEAVARLYDMADRAVGLDRGD